MFDVEIIAKKTIDGRPTGSRLELPERIAQRYIQQGIAEAVAPPKPKSPPRATRKTEPEPLED
ncbi:hypothetical protein GS597_01450 [Synechococcales cyanobacterium C]|uniref:Uncharacterized protein n=1 Tax=Petrachloros mirabilis ULC683 TaxID=2781853 RepID=A0A8K2ABW6_9CYAN|nr:hypothetical protein [Petrachloros mirabilis]NCJ05205.1 hypothetical protein [Petrachloros mirabilis ULC683]